MKKIILFLTLMPLMAADCRKQKEGQNCHYILTIENNSMDTVCIGYKFIGGVQYPGKCQISARKFIPPLEAYSDQQDYDCWEDVLSHQGSEDYFIIDKDSVFTDVVMYPCDSIYHYNKILKTITVSTENAKQNNFTFSYP